MTVPVRLLLGPSQPPWARMSRKLGKVSVHLTALAHTVHCALAQC